MSFKIVTWNVDWWNRSKASVADRIALLGELDADVAALQEVRGRQVPSYEKTGPSVFGSAFKRGENTSQWMLSGLVFRRGTTIEESGLIPLPYRDQRAVWARAMLPGTAQRITFLSWHSQHGVHIPAAEKGAMFDAVSEWLVAQAGPVVAGCDINTWTDPVDLVVADPDHDYASENRFVGPDPEHGLVDVYRSHLQNIGTLEELRRSSPEGPLCLSHSGTPTRRDRIFASPELAVLDSGYERERGFALSDHAPHWAVLSE